MKALTLLMAVLSAAVEPVVAQVPSWCSTQTFPYTSLCDDFDRYCTSLPPEPYACDGSTPADKLGLRELWEQNPPFNVCGVEIQTDNTSLATSSPAVAALSCHSNDVLGFASRGMRGTIRDAFGQTYEAVMGTDLNPLVLEFVLNGQTWSKSLFNNGYLELGLGDASAPTDFVHSPFCSTCGGPDARYAMICQQAVPPPGCGPIATAPHQPSIAVGFLAFLDDNACHCNDPSATWHSPYNEHLSFFDGHKWWKLRAGLFPTGSGDFRVRDDENIIKLTIKTSIIKVEMTCTNPNPDEYSWCEIPRDYMGPFNSMTLGFKHACKLKGSTVPGHEWECLNDPTCVHGAENGGVAFYDNIVLHGGMGDGAPGACCFPNTTCSEEYYMDCASLGGVFRGHGTTCSGVACPPPFKPDHDMDGDVDLTDFAWFQACLAGPEAAPSIPCDAADLDGDTFVDRLDLLSFIGCMSGADIPYAANCLP